MMKRHGNKGFILEVLILLALIGIIIVALDTAYIGLGKPTSQIPTRDSVHYTVSGLEVTEWQPEDNGYWCVSTQRALTCFKRIGL